MECYLSDLAELWRNYRENQVREAAYHKWLKAGSPYGNSIDFWVAAECEFDEINRGRLQLCLTDEIVDPTKILNEVDLVLPLNFPIIKFL